MAYPTQPVILVVDDEILILEMVQEILNMDGFKTILAGSGEEALEILDKGTRPNLIISDINMRGMDGFAFYTEVQKRPQLNIIPFIFLSALYDQPHVWHGKELGADDYLMKPFTREELIATIKGKLKRTERIIASVDAEISEIKAKILQMLSHEFRTPLTTIIGFSSVLYDESANLSADELKTFMELIKKGGDRLQNLVEDFLESVSYETGEMQKLYDSLKQNYQLDTVIGETIASLEDDKKSKKIKFESHIPDSLPLVFGYNSQVGNMIKRVLNNAYKFSFDEGKVILDVNIDEEYINITISDFGIGIPEDEISKIFDKFYQVKREKYEQQGSGLGLYIVKQIADVNLCKISCTSEVDKGSSFILSVPIAKN
jgi:two-component system, sensor histidine kinase and response regulator